MWLAGGRCRGVVLVDRDVEAALAKLFFYIDDAGGLIGEEMIAHPLHLAARETGLGDVDGGAREMRADDVAFGICCVVIHAHEVLLIFDGADGGADDERFVELGLVRTGKIGEKISGPLAAVASIFRDTGVDDQAGRFGHADERAGGDAVLKVDVVFDAFERLLLDAFVLADEGVVRSAEGISAIDSRNIQSSDLTDSGWWSGLVDRRRSERISSGLNGCCASGRDTVGLNGRGG